VKFACTCIVVFSQQQTKSACAARLQPHVGHSQAYIVDQHEGEMARLSLYLMSPLIWVSIPTLHQRYVGEINMKKSVIGLAAALAIGALTNAAGMTAVQPSRLAMDLPPTQPPHLAMDLPPTQPPHLAMDLPPTQPPHFV
jgi:hypothetical protein